MLNCCFFSFAAHFNAIHSTLKESGQCLKSIKAAPNPFMTCLPRPTVKEEKASSAVSSSKPPIPKVKSTPAAKPQTATRGSKKKAAADTTKSPAASSIVTRSRKNDTQEPHEPPAKKTKSAEKEKQDGKLDVSSDLESPSKLETKPKLDTSSGSDVASKTPTHESTAPLVSVPAPTPPTLTLSQMQAAHFFNQQRYAPQPQWPPHPVYQPAAAVQPIHSSPSPTDAGVNRPAHPHAQRMVVPAQPLMINTPYPGQPSQQPYFYQQDADGNVKLIPAAPQ